MMKRLKNMLFSAMLLLLAACMLFTGCGQKTTPPDNGDGTQNEGDAGNGGNNDNGNQNTEGAENGGEANESQGLESGFDFSESGRPSKTYAFLAYKSDKTVFDINDVTMEFFFGDEYKYGIERALDDTRGGYSYFYAFAYNEDGDEIRIKHYDENFISEKYTCDVTRDDNKNVVKVEYKYSELLTIPKELFNREEGRIWFGIKGWHTETWRDISITTHKKFYYKIVDDKVILSHQELE